MVCARHLLLVGISWRYWWKWEGGLWDIIGMCSRRSRADKTGLISSDGVFVVRSVEFFCSVV